jgi:hypothetical protein
MLDEMLPKLAQIQGTPTKVLQEIALRSSENQLAAAGNNESVETVSNWRSDQDFM